MQRFLDIGLRESRATDRSPSQTFLLWALPCIGWLATFYIFEVRIDRWPNEISGYPVFRDFANLWSGGIAALNHQFLTLFDQPRHAVELGHLFGGDPVQLIWSYPPTALLFIAPFAMLPFGWACVIWTTAGTAAYFLTVGGNSDATRGRAIRWIALLLCPGMFICLAYGQTALLTSAALIIGLREANKRPVIASVCFALLAAKPLIALVVPLVLIALRAWPAFALTSVFVAIYVGATVLAFGLEPWKLFFELTIPQQLIIMNVPRFETDMMISPYFLFRALGFSLSTSYALQLLISGLAMCWLFVALRSERDRNIQILMVACSVLLVSAYMRTYELPLLAGAVASVCASQTTVAQLGSRWLHCFFACVTVAPFVAWVLARSAGVNLTALIPIGLLFALGCRAIFSAGGAAAPSVLWSVRFQPDLG